MESTGVYWKPVYNLLEGESIEVLVVNAQHIKVVPGRKMPNGSRTCFATGCSEGVTFRIELSESFGNWFGIGAV